MHGTPEIVSLLINKGADVNAVSENGWWPLGLAVNRGHLEMVSRLLAAGAQVNRQDKESQLTPLHMAALKGYGKICALLIEKGADVNAKGPDGRTPLYYATRYRHQGVCSLLRKKAAPRRKSQCGKELAERAPGRRPGRGLVPGPFGLGGEDPEASADFRLLEEGRGSPTNRPWPTAPSTRWNCGTWT